MALTYPNIVPLNNLRLPDALTVKYGPAPLLSRFVLEGDKYVRETGIRLRLRHDFDELVHINKRATASGTWFPLINMFNPTHTDLTPEDSFWLSGERDNGDIVMTWAARVYYWPDTSFKEEAPSFFCNRTETRQPCRVTAPDASDITGVVFWGGSFWIHPDFRHLGLSPLLGRLGRAFAVSMAFNFVGYPIGAALAGSIASVSIDAAIIVGGVAALVAGVVAAVMIPRQEPALAAGGGAAAEGDPVAAADALGTRE